MNKIILIGGSPTAGKSHTAKVLAKRLDLPWISTDTIREQMRKIVRKEDYPDLFHIEDASSEAAVEFLTKYTANEIVEQQKAESVEVWKGVKAIIDTDYVWKSFIVEGVAILPDLVYETMKTNKSIKPVFIIDGDNKRTRETIYTRGLWNNADKYPDSVKEKEVEWVLANNEWLRRETLKYNLPFIEITDRKSHIKEIEALVL